MPQGLLLLGSKPLDRLLDFRELGHAGNLPGAFVQSIPQPVLWRTRTPLLQLAVANTFSTQRRKVAKADVRRLPSDPCLQLPCVLAPLR